MDHFRITKTLCPRCAAEIEGKLLVRDGKALLQSECPTHGVHETILSNHGDLYADFDAFYFTALDGEDTGGRISNYLVFIEHKCQMNCSYCMVEVDSPFFERMTIEQYRSILPNHRKAKHTFTGGEPTLHPDLPAFITEARRSQITVQLVTNGVRLADKTYCEELMKLGVDEFRVSIDSFDRKQAEFLGLQHFFDAKLKALHNLESLNLPTSISPTIFRGINEDQVVASCEYAKARPFIRSISINGFSWVTTLDRFSPNHTMMPDEMMDALYKRYCDGPREDFFTFQKTLHALLYLAGIRLCMNTHIMILVRKKGGLVPLTQFLNMNRMKRQLKYWQALSTKNIWIRRLAFLRVLMHSLTTKTLALIPGLTKLFFVNLFEVNIRNYPSAFLPVIFTTHCSSCNFDETLSKKCMSGNLYTRHEHVRESYSTHTLSDKEKNRDRNTQDTTV